ncbi:MAG TPA: hypothetical protein IAB50_02310 [Candidatus Faecivicinus avistercoris]|nr:hypothetical protein [Candidatus Faecivicinus avistercoris]
MGFSDAKISARAGVQKRFCRFSKSSKSVGPGQLENPMGFQPSAGHDFLREGFDPLALSIGVGKVERPAGTLLRGAAFFEKCLPRRGFLV